MSGDIFRKKRSATLWTQAKLLTVRFVQMYWLTPTYSMARFIIEISLALVAELTYVDVDLYELLSY